MHLSIRKAVPADAEALSELYLHHLTETPPGPPQDLRLWRETRARVAGDPRYHLLVGEADGAVISTVTLVIVENLTHGMRPYALIENVVTHRAHRGKHCAAPAKSPRKTAATRSCC